MRILTPVLISPWLLACGLADEPRCPGLPDGRVNQALEVTTLAGVPVDGYRVAYLKNAFPEADLSSHVKEKQLTEMLPGRYFIRLTDITSSKVPGQKWSHVETFVLDCNVARLLIRTEPDSGIIRDGMPFLKDGVPILPTLAGVVRKSPKSNVWLELVGLYQHDPNRLVPAESDGHFEFKGFFAAGEYVVLVLHHGKVIGQRQLSIDLKQRFTPSVLEINVLQNTLGER